MKRLSILLLLLALAFISKAQWEQLNGPNAYFGTTAIAYNDSLLVASVPCGTFYSFNGGIKWKLLNNETFTKSVIFHDTLYTNYPVDLIYQNSSPKGLRQLSTSNNLVSAKEMYDFFTYAPLSADIVDLYADKSTIYAAVGDSGLYYSTDARTWHNNIKGMPRDSFWYPEGRSGEWKRQYQLHSISGNDKYLFGGTNHGVYKYSLSAGSWSNTSNNLPGKPVSTVMCKDSVIIASTGYNNSSDSVGIYKSADNGNSWNLVYAISPCTINSIKNIHDTLYILTSSEYPNTNNAQGLFISYDLGSTWNRVSAEVLTSFFSIEEYNNQIYLAADSGIYKNLPDITNVSNNIVCSNVESLKANDSTIVALYSTGNDMNEIAFTENDGITWTNNNLTKINVNYITDIATIGNTYYFLGGNSYLTDSFQSYLSYDNGRTWNLKSKIDGFLGYYFGMVTNGPEIITRNDDYNILFSRDSGKTWNNITPNYSDLGACDAVNSTLLAGSNIYLSTCSSGEIIQSTDFGAHWFLSGNGLTNTQYFCGYFNNILISYDGTSLYASLDNGAHWQLWSTQDIPSFGFTSDGKNIYATDNTSTFFSADSGKTWNFIPGSLPAKINCLLVKDNYLYAGTSGFGVWKHSTLNLPLATQNIKGVTAIDLFPNPTNGEVHLTHLNVGSLLQVNIYNLSGQLVQSNQIATETTFNITSLIPGLYIVKITKGNDIYYSKLVKQ